MNVIISDMYFSSTIIEDLIRHCQSNPTFRVAYFYFDFVNEQEQRYESFLRSLVAQLFAQNMSIPETLQTLYSNSQDGQQQPKTDEVVATLESFLEESRETYIILDALDECTDREEILALIREIHGNKTRKLHILATSRRKRDIEEALERLNTGQVRIQDAQTRQDIQLYIRKRLDNDTMLKKWPEAVKIEAENALMDGAHGL